MFTGQEIYLEEKGIKIFFKLAKLLKKKLCKAKASCLCTLNLIRMLCMLHFV